MIKKLLRKLFDFCYKEDLKRLRQTTREMNESMERLDRLRIEVDKDLKKIEYMYKHVQLLSNIDCSVDVHHHAKSWAVVSIQGKQADYIKFLDLDDASLHEISMFLRQFDRNSVKIDANPTESGFLKKETWYRM